MRPNKIKHKILKALNEHYQDGEERSGHGHQVTELGKSLTNMEIHKRTHIDVKDIDNFCISLVNSNHISVLTENENDKIRRFLITPWGRQTVLENYFLNIDGEKQWTKVKDILLVAAAVGSFIFAMVTFSQNKVYQQQIKDLTTRIEKFEKSQKTN
jgi:hypothetical protein